MPSVLVVCVQAWEQSADCGKALPPSDGSPLHKSGAESGAVHGRNEPHGTAGRDRLGRGLRRLNTTTQDSLVSLT